MSQLERIICGALGPGLVLGVLVGGPLMFIGYVANGFEPIFWPFFLFWAIGTVAGYVATYAEPSR